MSYQRIPGPFCTIPDSASIDTGTLNRGRSSASSPTGVDTKPVTYSYAISGTVGALGSMLFTEISNRLPGTLYDRTLQTTQLRTNEAKLGLSGFGNAEFRKLARKTIDNMNAPPRVDVDIHFQTKGRVETINVRGQHGTRSFRFDFNKVEQAAKKLPKGTDPFKPFNDTINKILTAIVQVR